MYAQIVQNSTVPTLSCLLHEQPASAEGTQSNDDEAC